ncbi:RNA-binding protein 41 [Thalassophryne amazonica]|uniref:RNA-binding protein 41 n=1 Tax=Thalassophryne amazonica TaxID=390379 RepID=UPI0014724B1B|nr:RNA-binding protein 41 [Thalassophryne amazonica]XP_034033804.1 RNA-binding protein 41 [Thalassophryne amazonica]
MRRVSRRSCEDGPLLEEQETEGQRQFHSLLLQQLHTDVDISRCLAKRQCFAPAALYRPFGEQAAGVRSLSQFQALEDGEKELVGLQELGLTEAEIHLWQNRNEPESTEKSHGVCAAPGVRQQRLQVIRDKIEARVQLLSRPQRFSSSRPLSRREMEIERALFQGNERLGFLTALYHRDEDNQEGQQGASSSDPVDSLYKDVLSEGRQTSLQDAQAETPATSHATSHRTEPHQKNSQRHGDHLEAGSQEDDSQSQASEHNAEQLRETRSLCQSASRSDTADQAYAPDTPGQAGMASLDINIRQQIGRLSGCMEAGSREPLTLRGEIEVTSREEILKNRESEEGIRRIPRFRNYHPGKPSKVLCVKNLSAHATVAQLVALFSRFEPENGPSIIYRLLTGRLKGQAFITLPDAETAQTALQLVHGYRLLGKPLVVEFGRERQTEEIRREDEVQEDKK